VPVHSTTLTADLTRLVNELETDVKRHLEASDDGALAALRAEHATATKADRTSESWVDWYAAQVTQAVVGWVLATVFLRFCEDNGLVDRPWLAGPGERTRMAHDAQTHYFTENPRLNDRDWLLEAFGHLEGFPALAAVLDPAHNPLHRLAISSDGAEAVVRFWRRTDSGGALEHDFTDPTLSTRFLGDLYQDLSEAARKRFALLQTPEFVEEFILDRTLEPALADRPLEGFRMIDPTCGSGHFLLGAFARLVDRWAREAPALDPRERVQRALDAVHGVDLNPFAVAVARFRLTVAAMQACGMTRLAEAPAFRYHLAVGDSLLHGPGQMTLAADTDLAGFVYAAEDLQQLEEILRAGRYDAVVGNPPYITVKDKTLNQAYRDRYTTCKGTYALTVPFMERFFGLAKRGDSDEPAGWVGQITSNSFMKREFGSKLIEEFLSGKDLRLVADTSGAYIPGHGTPTVVLVGRNQRPVGSTVRAVLGVRGEPGRPDDPAKGIVWRSIVEHVDEPGWDDSWITITDLDRTMLNAHPWSLSGGGASQLLAAVEGGRDRLGSLVAGSIGGSIRAGADEAFLRPVSWRPRSAVLRDRLRPLLTGEVVRDWASDPHLNIFYPYTYGTKEREDGGLSQELWPMRTLLAGRGTFSGNMADAGLAWWEYMQHTSGTYRTPLSIAFAFVATHNHFVLDRGGKVFKQSAPVIKLPEGTTDDEHLALLGVLNSSTACFWLKQNSHNKGSTVDQTGARQTTVEWENFYEFTGTTLQDYPLAAVLPLERGRLLDTLAQDLAAQWPEAVAQRAVPTAEALTDAREESARLRAQMVAVQEELDWEVYRLYGLVEEDLTYSGDDLPGLALGERAFEVLLARAVAAGEEETAWFTRHGSTPVTDLPAHWPEAYRALVQRRLELIASDPALRLLEKPEHKRRWASESWEKRQERALRGWLLDRLEDPPLWTAGGRPQVQSVQQLADRVAGDQDLLAVLALWAGRPDVDLVAALETLLADEHVPFLAALRYTPKGLEKRAAWEQVWELQRAQDRGEPVGDVPVPPKYAGTDFVRQSYWSHRGKLDVPKERFISYPGAERGADGSLVLGWAGWDHAEQAMALAALSLSRAQREAWDARRLTPLLAGLAELEPWVHQWHAETDPRTGQSAAVSLSSTLDRETARLGLTRDDLAAWRPAPSTRGRRARSTTTTEGSTA
jgi:hypothetical protein